MPPRNVGEFLAPSAKQSQVMDGHSYKGGWRVLLVSFFFPSCFCVQLILDPGMPPFGHGVAANSRCRKLMCLRCLRWPSPTWCGSKNHLSKASSKSAQDSFRL